MKFLFKNLYILLGTVTPVIPALRKYKQEGSEFKLTLSYIGSLTPVWATRDLLSKKKKKFSNIFS